MPVLAHSSITCTTWLIRVDDPPSRYSREIEERVALRQEVLISHGLRPRILELKLFARDQEIVDAFDGLMGEQPRGRKVELWLDITSFPKRFFFLLIKLAILNRRVETLVVLYSQPAPGQYTPQHLAEDPDGVRPLPGFGPSRDEANRLIISLGFEALGLPQFLGEYRDRRRDIAVLLPFPPGQPYSRRIWASLLATGVDPQGPGIRRVSAIDAFDAYFHLSQLAPPSDRATRNRPPALAPYGPKPVSAGMCLYSLDTGAPVFYTQPRVYHPDYTMGIGQGWAYCFKLEGKRTWG